VSEPRSAARRRGAIRAVLVATLLLTSGVVGFLAYRLATRHTPLTPVAASLPPPGTGPAVDTAADERERATPTIPESLPDIRLPGTDGATHRLRDWTGKPLLINFWATWCEPCRREIPLLLQLRHEHAADRLEIVGIAIDSLEAVRQYAAGRRIDYPLLIGDQGGLAAASAFGMETVLPFSVFADRSGRVVTVKIGELHRDEAELILDRIHGVDTGTLPLAAAREQIASGVERLNVARAAPPGTP
jgi:thiol-disulfide isomerase/thioredoxin